MTQLMRLQPGIETPLPLIQQTVEQKDGGFQFWQRCRRQQRFLDPHSPVALPAASVVAAGARLAGTSTHRHRRSAVAQFVVAGKDAAAALSPRRAGVLLTRSP